MIRTSMWILIIALLCLTNEDVAALHFEFALPPGIFEVDGVKVDHRPDFRPRRCPKGVVEARLVEMFGTSAVLYTHCVIYARRNVVEPRAGQLAYLEEYKMSVLRCSAHNCLCGTTVFGVPLPIEECPAGGGTIIINGFNPNVGNFNFSYVRFTRPPKPDQPFTDLFNSLYGKVRQWVEEPYDPDKSRFLPREKPVGGIKG